MLHSLKKILISDLFKSISIYTFFRMLNRSLPVLLLPFLTHHLSPEDYSIIDVFTNLSYIVLPLIGLNAYSAASRFYYEKEIDYKIYLSSIINFILISYIILSIMSFFIEDFIFASLNINKINFFLFLVITYSLFEQLFLIYTTNLRLEEKAVEYGITGFIRTSIELLLTIILVLFIFSNWKGRIFAQFIGLLLVTFFSLYKLFKQSYISFKFLKQYLVDSLKFGLPLIIHTVSGILLGFSNRFFIIKYLGLHEAGIFASAYQIGLAISLLHTSFNEAWVPYLFKNLTNNDCYKTRKKLVKITYYYYIFLFLLTILFILFTPILYKIISRNFYISSINLIFIAFAFLFNGYYKMIVNYLFYEKKTYYVAIGTLIALFLNFAFNFFFITKYSLLGASIALFFTFFCHFIIFLLILNYNFKLPWLYFLDNLKNKKS